MYGLEARYSSSSFAAMVGSIDAVSFAYSPRLNCKTYETEVWRTLFWNFGRLALRFGGLRLGRHVVGGEILW